MNETEYRATITTIFVIFVILASLTLLPLIDAIIVAFFLAYLMRPVNSILLNYVNKTYAAIISVIVVIIPAFMILFHLANATVNYVIKERVFQRLLIIISDLDSYLKDIIISSLSQYNIEYSQDLDRITNVLIAQLNQFLYYISEQLLDFTLHIPEYAMKLLLAAILALYLIKEGTNVTGTFVALIPENKKKTISSILQGIDIVFESIILVNVLKAIYTAAVSYVIFLLFQVPYPEFLAILAGVIDFVPIIGPWMLFSAIAIFFIMNGQLMTGILIFIVGFIFVSLTSELYVRPKLAGKYAKIHPMVFLFGFFGGLLAFGPIGIVAGPIILGIVIVFIKYYLLGKEIETKNSFVDKLLSQVDKMIKLEGSKDGKV